MQLKLALETRVKEGPATLDVVGWMGRTALELVGQGGLGHSFDPLTEDAQDEYTEAVKGFSYVSSHFVDGLMTDVCCTHSAANSDLRHLRGFLPYIVRLGPAWFRRILLDLAPYEKLQRVKRNCDIVNQGCLSLFNAKKEALRRGDETLLQLVGEGKDVMSVLREYPRLQMTAVVLTCVWKCERTCLPQKRKGFQTNNSWLRSRECT